VKIESVKCGENLNENIGGFSIEESNQSIGIGEMT